MAASIDQARANVQSAFTAALSVADSDERRSFAEFESQLWTLMLALGRALVVLFLARQANRERPFEYRRGGRLFRVDDRRASELGTLFGKVRFERPIGRQVEDRSAAADLPVDRELLLGSGFSLGVILGVTRLTAQMAFGAARATFREIHKWAPSPRGILRMVDSVGKHAREFLEKAPAPTGDGETLVIQVDARGAPMISEVEGERRRQPHAPRTPGTTGRNRRRQQRKSHPRARPAAGKDAKKSKNAKAAVVGVIYTLQRTPDGIEGPINKRVYATFDSHRALGEWLLREAIKRGYGHKRTIFLGDGSAHIWRIQQELFPLAEACIDWYHVMEYLWSGGEVIHKKGSAELKAWIGRQARRLRHGAAKSVLDELKRLRDEVPKTGPGTKRKRKRLDRTIKYLTDNYSRLIYEQLRRDDLDIGTGAVEGAVRNLVGMRLDGPGMRWGRLRAESVLHLRCILLNGQWDDFSDHLAKGPPLTLEACPVPLIPHTARKAA